MIPFDMQTKPKISIIIPSAPDRNPEAIIKNIEDIVPRDFETELFVIKGTWPPLQRNMGIRKAKGDYIFFFDDDVVVPKNSIEKALETFEKNPEVQVVGGPNLTPPDDNFLQQCFGEAHASYFVGLKTAVRYRKVKEIKNVTENDLITCNLAFRSKILKENPFNPVFYANEENELLGRIIRKGNRLAYNPDFFVYHHRRKNFSSYIQQIFKWGEGRTIHNLKSPSHFRIEFLVPLVFLLYLLSLFYVRQNWYFFPLIAYILLAFWYGIEIAVKRGARYFFPMLFIFFITHVSYGFGLAWGFFSYFKKPFSPAAEGNFKLISFIFNQ